MKTLMTYIFTIFSIIVSTNSVAGIDSLLDNMMGKKPVTLHIQLFDTTQSIKDLDKSLYRETSSKQIASIHAGDRLVIARISERQLGEFTVDSDMIFSKSGRHFEDSIKSKKLKASAMSTVEKILGDNAAATKSTRILEVFSALNPLINEARVKKMHIKIYAMTDAIEESPSANMATQIVNNTFIDHIISRQKQQKLLPDLTGVDLYFVGGSGPSPAAAKAIENFWRTYISLAKGQVIFYGRTIPDFHQ